MTEAQTLEQTKSMHKLIEQFLSQKRIAIVGVSHQPREFSRMVYAEFCRRGYDVFPVNPHLNNIDGRPCFARVQDIVPAPDAVLILTPPHVTEQIVRDCAEAGARRVWMHRGEGLGAVSADAMMFCDDHGIDVIAGYCPYMFLDHPGLLHSTHGTFLKLTGHFPH